MVSDQNFITAIRHPDYLKDEMYWEEWRETYEGGPQFVLRNLKKFSNRETEEDFKNRKLYTPIPSFSKAAVNDIRNSIFQRLRDVYRRGGSENYMKSTSGEIGGVDNKGSSMQSFLGIDVLTELLVMGRVGVYVDMPKLSGFRTMADEGNARPYCYMYRVEDILSWAETKPEEPGDYKAILLRDQGISYTQGFANGVHLPSGSYTRYRFIWIDPIDRMVRMKLYDENERPIDLNGLPVDDESVIKLELNRIPFAMLDINGSVLKDVYKHQVALLNLGSSDVSYALKANYPFYVEQKDKRAVGSHLKKVVDDDGTTVTSDNSEGGTEVRTGITHGRTYDLKADRPAFIHPSSEPLIASMKLQEKLEDDIRKLVNLAVQNKVGQRVMSGEAMKLSDQGLEAGLSYIGLVLENAERKVAEHWAAYENKNPDQRQVATIKYPDRYSLKDDKDRIEEAEALSKLMYTVPGREIKKELAKNIVTALLSGKVNTNTIDIIFGQIDEADYATSDPEIIIRAREAGLVGERTASMAVGFSDDEYLQARKDHAERARRILEVQQAGKQPNLEGMAARGVEDLDSNARSGEEEREEATDTTMRTEEKKPVRGRNKTLER
jgi:hypothetical protein